MTKPLRFENKSLRLKSKCLICIWIIFWAILDLFINPKYLFQNKSFSQTYYFKSEKSFVILTSLLGLKINPGNLERISQFVRQYQHTLKLLFMKSYKLCGSWWWHWKGDISQSFRGKHIIWVSPLENWRLPTQLIIFPDFWAKVSKIAAQKIILIYLPGGNGKNHPLFKVQFQMQIKVYVSYNSSTVIIQTISILQNFPTYSSISSQFSFPSVPNKKIFIFNMKIKIKELFIKMQ